MQTFFNPPLSKGDIELLYYSKLDELPINYELKTIETSYGDTNIILTGEKSNPPLVLIHGSNGCAPIAIEAMIGLEKDFSIYAIDVVGQPNLSEEFRPDMRDDSYGKWMFEILTRLNIYKATLVGISFGGFISWKTLAFDARRISRAFLIVPAGIVKGNPLKAIWKVFLPMKFFKWRKQKKYIRQILKELFTESDEFAMEFLSKVFLYFKMDLSPIPLIKKEEAKNIKTPIHIIAADDDVLFPGKRMLKRAKQVFPSLSENILLKKSKHVPSQQANENIVAFIKNNSN